VEVRFELNGRTVTLETDRRRTLLDLLREDLDLTGTKYGCGEGQCGACTVLIEGRPERACLTPVSQLGGKRVATIEGLAEGERLHPVQRAFIEEGAMQCGYCVPGMIMATAALLEAKPSPTREEINEALSGHLCRCCNYLRILAAVERAARMSRGDTEAAP